MGDNSAFTIFEATVIGCYNKGVLDKDLLETLAEPYRDTDIDSGGMVGTLAKDGLDIIDIVIKANGGEVISYPSDIPKDYRKWTPEQESRSDKWHEERWEKFSAITKF